MAPGADEHTGRRTNVGVGAYVAALGAIAVVVAVALVARDATPAQRWAALPVLAALLVAGETFLIRYRYRGETDTLNLLEAPLAPLLFGFAGPVAMATMFVAQGIAGAIRRNAPIKASFNAVQWTLATGAASLVVGHTTDDGLGWRVAAVVGGLAVAGVINQLAVTGVLAIVERSSPRAVLATLMQSVGRGWLVGWTVNSVIGVIFVLAYVAHPAAVVLFPVPMLALYFAHRAAAGAWADRLRMNGVHRAMQVLTGPLDPTHAMSAYLREVRDAFEAGSVVLLTASDGEVTARRLGRGDDLCSAGDATPDERALLDENGAGRTRAGEHDCLYAVHAAGEVTVAVVVCDVGGFEGFAEDSDAFVARLARETAGVLEKGRLVERAIEERHRFAHVLGSTSDGICTIAADGAILTWNAAMTSITGLAADDVVGSRSALYALHPRRLTGAPVDLHGWARAGPLPRDLRVTTVGGEPRRLSCSYTAAPDHRLAGSTLVVVARDVTSLEEMEALRAQFGRLAEAEATHRDVVDHLQEAVMPAPLDIEGVSLAVRYVSSDAAAPTGGDLYDWQVLPSGELHVVVVDVLGHGVEATKDALAVVHALRVLAVQDLPLEALVVEADRLLTAQRPGLVATLVVARYDPATGVVRVAGGGHPSPIVVSPYGGVDEIDAPGGPIGWPNAGSDDVREARLDDGDALVLFTDGVVEAHKDYVSGLANLRRDVDTLAHLPADALATELLDRALDGAGRRDDSLLLVLQRRAATWARTWSIAPAASSVGDVRRALAADLVARGVDADCVAEVSVVVSELLTNAVQAARSSVTLTATLGPGGIDLVCSDDGTGFDPSIPPLPLVDATAESGRGLRIVRSLAERFVVRSGAEGTIVRVRVPSGSLSAPGPVADPSSARSAP